MEVYSWLLWDVSADVNAHVATFAQPRPTTWTLSRRPLVFCLQSRMYDLVPTVSQIHWYSAEEYNELFGVRYLGSVDRRWGVVLVLVPTSRHVRTNCALYLYPWLLIACFTGNFTLYYGKWYRILIRCVVVRVLLRLSLHADGRAS